jgi:hypothetical protein
MIFKLLTAPLTLPMAGMKFVFQQVADLADQELNDEDNLREQLLLLQVQLEEGDIDDDDFAEREADILARLRAIKERKLVASRESRVESQDELPVEANVDARRRFIIESPFELNSDDQ